MLWVLDVGATLIVCRKMRGRSSGIAGLINLSFFCARLGVWGVSPVRNVGQTPHVSLPTAAHSPLIGASLCSITCTHTLIGCRDGEDKQEVKASRTLFGFTPGQVLWGLWLCKAGFGTSICLIQLSLSFLVMRDFWSRIDAKLWVDYWILVFIVCVRHCDCSVLINILKYLKWALKGSWTGFCGTTWDILFLDKHKMNLLEIALSRMCPRGL